VSAGPGTGLDSSSEGIANAAGPRWLTRFEAALGLMVEIPAALLVLADILVLFAGVIARYVFHTPLLWSDELAAILFLWLAMLGSVIALRRGEHMRMTALVSKASPERRALMEMVATAASLAFLAMVAWPAWEYASEERAITTPALEISNLWRAAALPVGIVLMGLFAMLRLLRTVRLRQSLQAVAIVACICIAFWFAAPLFEDLGRLNLLIFFVGVSDCVCFRPGNLRLPGAGNRNALTSHCGQDG